MLVKMVSAFSSFKANFNFWACERLERLKLTRELHARRNFKCPTCWNSDMMTYISFLDCGATLTTVAAFNMSKHEKRGLREIGVREGWTIFLCPFCNKTTVKVDPSPLGSTVVINW